MILGSVFIYLAGLILIGFPILAICDEKSNSSLTEEMGIAIFVLYPISLVVLLIYGTIVIIKGLLAFIILLFKGGLF